MKIAVSHLHIGIWPVWASLFALPLLTSCKKLLTISTHSQDLGKELSLEIILLLALSATLLLKSGGNEESKAPNMFMVSYVNDDLWESQSNLVEKP